MTNATALAAVAGGEGGSSRLIFGTDHPFFPPINDDGGQKEGKTWLSVESNLKAIEGVFRDDEEAKSKVLGGNAISVLGLDIHRPLLSTLQPCVSAPRQF